MYHNGAPRSPKVLKKRHKVCQSATKTIKCGPRCQKNDIPTYRHISSKIHDFFSSVGGSASHINNTVDFTMISVVFTMS